MLLWPMPQRSWRGGYMMEIWAVAFSRSALRWQERASGVVSAPSLQAVSGDIGFFLYGFKKNEREDITDQERAALKALAKDLLALSEAELQTALQDGAMREIKHGQT